MYYVANPNGYTVNPTTQQVVRLAPDAPFARTVATVHAPTSQLYADAPPAVALGDSFYFLDSPTISYLGGTAAPVAQGTGVLYRVSPHARP